MKDYKRAENAYSLALKLQPDLKLAKENYNKLMSSSYREMSKVESV